MSFAFRLRRSLTNSSITSIPSESLQDYTVQRIKDRIQNEYESNKDLYDDKDIERYTQTAYIRRYLERQNGVEEKTIEMMLKMLRMRKETDLSIADDQWIPLEFYKVGALFIYNEDKNGNIVLYMRVKCHRKFPEMKLPMQNFVAYTIMKIDAMAVEKGEHVGYTIVFDLTGVSMSNYDLPELVFVIDFFCQFMSAGLKRVLVNNLPWYFKPVVSIALAFIPEEWKKVIKFISKDEIFKYIEKHNVPKFLGGTCEQSHRDVPKGCRSVREIAKEQFDLYKVSDDKVVKLLKSYEKMFTED